MLNHTHLLCNDKRICSGKTSPLLRFVVKGALVISLSTVFGAEGSTTATRNRRQTQLLTAAATTSLFRTSRNNRSHFYSVGRRRRGLGRNSAGGEHLVCVVLNSAPQPKRQFFQWMCAGLSISTHTYVMSAAAPHTHFFAAAPTISWLTWATRRFNPFTQLPQAPTQIPATYLQERVPLPANTTVTVTLPNPAAMQQICQFLRTHFYNPQQNLQVDLPPQLLQQQIQSGAWICVEARTSKQELVGCAMALRAGHTNDLPTALIHWLCIHPSFRKRGLTNTLLRTLYYVAQPVTVFFWRNDGWLQSPVPPIWTDQRMVRGKNGWRVMSRLHTQQQPNIKKVPWATYAEQIKQSWRAGNSTGFILDDQTPQGNRTTEVYEYTVSNTLKIVLLVQPTFERRAGKSWAEVITWAAIGSSCSEYAAAQSIETILDHLPYDNFEASTTLPHIEERWQKAQTTTWSLIGLDPGVPVMRPVLPCVVG